jgi:hypothetical protein
MIAQRMLLKRWYVQDKDKFPVLDKRMPLSRQLSLSTFKDDSGKLMLQEMMCIDKITQL